MSRFPENDSKFESVRAMRLPIGEYAITSSGPLGIRGIRQIGDIDMVVSRVLWDKLAEQYEVINSGEFKKLEISPVIEAFCEESFPNRDAAAPTIEQQIAKADLIDGLAFVNLHHILFFKEKMGREKDKADTESIQTILAS